MSQTANKEEATGCGVVMVAVGLIALCAAVGGSLFGFPGIIGGLGAAFTLMGLGIIILAIRDT